MAAICERLVENPQEDGPRIKEYHSPTKVKNRACMIVVAETELILSCGSAVLCVGKRSGNAQHCR